MDEVIRVADNRATVWFQRFEYVLILPLRLDAHQSSLPFDFHGAAGFEHLIEDAIDVLPEM
jgi:hypothetical protein